MLEAEHQFRRVNGHLHLPKLRVALDAHFTGNVSAVSQNAGQKVAWWSPGPPGHLRSSTGLGTTWGAGGFPS
jgi:hypothetical protein